MVSESAAPPCGGRTMRLPKATRKLVASRTPLNAPTVPARSASYLCSRPYRPFSRSRSTLTNPSRCAARMPLGYTRLLSSSNESPGKRFKSNPAARSGSIFRRSTSCASCSLESFFSTSFLSAPKYAATASAAGPASSTASGDATRTL